MIIESIKEGFNLANRNLQLVLVRIAVAIINLFGLLIFLGVPLVVAVMYLGLDMTHAGDMLPFFTENPLEFASKYLGLVFLMGVSFIFYLVFSSLLFLYSLGGTLGVLKNAALNMHYRFRLSSFFREGNSNFAGLLWLVSLFLLCAIALLVILTVSGGIVALSVQGTTGAESTIETFFSSFAMLTVVIFGLIIILAGLIFAMYSVVVLVIDGKGVKASISRTYAFLKQKPQAFLLYIILFVGLVTANAVFYGIQVSSGVMPLMTPLAYILSTFFQNYLTIVVWGSMVVYYIKSMNYPVNYVGYEI